MPPESSCGKLFSQPSSPTSFEQLARRRRARPAACARRRLPAAARRSASAVRQGSSAASWNTKPSARLAPRLLRRHAEHRRPRPRSATRGRRPRAAASTCRSPRARAGVRKPPLLDGERDVLERRDRAPVGDEAHRDVAAGHGRRCRRRCERPRPTPTPAAASSPPASASADLRPAVGRSRSGCRGSSPRRPSARAWRTGRAAA